MTPKDAALNKNTTKVYNALYENYKPIYPFYKFDIGDNARIVKKKKTFEKDILQIDLKNYLLWINS